MLKGGCVTQFRKNNKRSIFSRVLSFIYGRRVGYCGDGVAFDSLVYLMRYPMNIKLQDRVYIKGGARICPCNSTASIEIGVNTTIGYNACIFSSSKISIGDNCMIAPNVYIVDSDHGMRRGVLMNMQENITDEVYIGSDVWIGAGAVILKGSNVADGCIIAANSVVKGALEAGSIYGGVPAKKIGER